MMYRFKLVFVPILLHRKQCLNPILTLFSETVSNLASIRSYNLEDYFMNKMQTFIDNERQYMFLQQSLFGWLTVNIELLCNVILFFAIICTGYQISVNKNNNNIKFMILGCWYFISLQQLMPVLLRGYVAMQAMFVGATILMKYHTIFHENKTFGNELVHEAPQFVKYDNYKDEQKLHVEGNIEIDKLQLRYRKHLDLALNIDQTIIISHGSKIGIVGRTGCGKSSILVSIFRLFEPTMQSKIKIDGLNSNALGLYDLRSNLEIITQHPVLFGNCSLRFNIDPYDTHDDDEIYKAIKLVNLSLFNEIDSRRVNKLNCIVEENGSNFSEGEKQCICFIRVLLKKPKILFIDEGTSAIDKDTDRIIQELIRSDHFKNTTVLSIAHRISSIIDYDYIMVMDNGKIAQYDTPKHLLQEKHGIFANLVHTDNLYTSNSF
eukprot:329510_1